MKSQTHKSTPQYQPYTLQNYRQIPQIARLSEEEKFAIEVVGHILPFRSNHYVVSELIDWDQVPNDPMFILTFPQRDMLSARHFDEMADVLRREASRDEIQAVANRIRWELNPHPAGQRESNVPVMDGHRLSGMQHKYRETVLFFPSQGQTCHAYCTFCFRWPQFVGIQELKFASREAEQLVQYVGRNDQITDILFTGGDPLIMKSRTLASYIDALLDAGIPHLRSIRIGTKSLGYWPYRFLTDSDADDLLSLFERVHQAGKHLAIMAHFSHPNELRTQAVADAVGRIRATGAQIRTQSPILHHINDDATIWAEMWRKQVGMGLIPYYMFVARNTGAQHYFAVPLVRAWEIYRSAYQQVSGLARTVRGPSMSANPGKIQVLGVSEIRGEKVLCLRFLQGRNPDWVHRPFFARFDPDAIWLDDLRPAFGKAQFFFQDEMLTPHGHGAPARIPLSRHRLVRLQREARPADRERAK